ncbi:MAG: hypothetical protein JWM78_161 [Verrucomicrobiaceae bacterium]|nr:hypothetical protein [Verrucomicrobiaceae bacterium]
MQWAILPILACVQHKRMLVDTERETGDRLGWYRGKIDKFCHALKQVRPGQQPISPSVLQFSKYFESLILKSGVCAKPPSAMSELGFREALTMFNFLAHYQARLLGDAFSPVSLDGYSLAKHYDGVWRMICNWPDDFYFMLSQYIDNPMSARGVSGVNKHYRDLYERLHRQQRNEGVARIKFEFDRYIQTYWPGLLEADRMTRINLILPRSRIVSKNEAARIIGCRPERIDKYVRTERLSRIIFKGKAHYSRCESEKLASLISSNWTVTEACEALQITRYQLKQLLDAEVFPAIQRPNKFDRDWIVDKARCQFLVDRLLLRVDVLGARELSLSMGGIQRRGFSIVQLISAMQSGHLEFSVRPDKTHPYSLKQFTSFKLKLV